MTPPGQREVAGFEHKARGLGNSVPSRVEHVGSDVCDRTTPLTQQMEVGVIGQVVDRPTMTEVDVIDDRQFCERIERAIHGRLVDRGMATRDLRCEVVGCWMVAAGDQRFDDCAARLGQSTARLLQAKQDVVHCRVGHAGDATPPRFLAERTNGVAY